MTPRCLGSCGSDFEDFPLDLDTAFFDLSSSNVSKSSLKSLDLWISCALNFMSGLTDQDHTPVEALIRAVVEFVQIKLGLELDRSVVPRPLPGSLELGIEFEVRNSYGWGVVLLQAVLGQPSRSDYRNLVVLRDAAFNQELGARSRRDSKELVSTVMKTDGCSAHQTSQSGKYCAVFTVVDRKGLPVNTVLEELEQNFRGNGRVLTEDIRYFLRDIFGTMNIFQEKGYQMHVNCIKELFYDRHFSGGSVTFGNMGMGTVVRQARTHIQKGVRMANRLITEAFVSCPARDVPADVNRSHLRELRKKRNDSQNFSVSEPRAKVSVTVTGIPSSCIKSLWNDMCQNPTGHLEIDEGVSSGSLSGQALSPCLAHQAILWDILPRFASSEADMGPQLPRRKQALHSALKEGREATVRFFHNEKQPMATERLSELAYKYLAMETLDVSQICTEHALAMPTFLPEQERLLRTEGLRMTVGRCVRENAAWVAKMKSALRGYEDEDAEPLQADLVIEGDKGVGVRVVGTWMKSKGKKKRFGGWYVGRAVRGDLPLGGRRYIASSARNGTVRCDAEPCEKCPLQWYIDKGITGPFYNSDTKDPKLGLDRDVQFEDEGLLWIPMYILCDFYGFASWSYALSLASLRA